MSYLTKSWYDGYNVKKQEFKELIETHESFFLKLAKKASVTKAISPEFNELSKKKQVMALVKVFYTSKERWFWVYCFDNTISTMRRRGEAYQHILDYDERKIYTDESFPLKKNVPCEEGQIAFGTSKHKYELCL